MDIRILHNKKEIHNFLSKSPDLQLYSIGDLDDFFWPYTIWYGIFDTGEIQSVAMLYTRMTPPTLLLFYYHDPFYSTNLLKSIKPLLPQKFLVHLGPGLIDVLGFENIIDNYGQNYRMILMKEPVAVYDNNIRQLSISDLPAIKDLISIAYPNNWFDSRMVETGKYFGYFKDKSLIGISGVHVYSAKYRIAALGNIATHPDHRRQQIAFKLTSILCRDLRKTADIVGLNVKSDNKAAINCYSRIGFEIRSSYDECYVKNI
jgi:ribosomal protein S18 acetylase RimI-like enzyme